MARGSSPHTRGALRIGGVLGDVRGIIPAYAGSTEKQRTTQARGADHPRIRGEHRRRRPHPDVDRGSSPHTRGAHPVERKRLRCIRIIPAYAGSTWSASASMTPPSDHPRIRGEHAGDDDSTTEIEGSSPHTRGALLADVQQDFACGIIPAYAGSTPYRDAIPSTRPDHPRIRGEHWSASWLAAVPPGSSPHTRGALGAGPGEGPHRRIIPAYAGSTFFVSAVTLILMDHPRIRGEHPADGVDNPWFPRIIPAYAGSTPGPSPPWRHPGGSSPHTRGARRLRTSRRRWRGDHPRIRGEHSPVAPPYSKHEGSSPHTRGALLHAHTALKTTRIIPAYAGSTRRITTPPRRRADHPRIRGEHCQAILPVSSLAGSSPHTRGAPDRGQARQPRHGIIPAYAGSTLA